MNGKAIMSGVRLLDLDSADLLDVLHYMLEDDMNVTSEEHSKTRDHVRTRLYAELYETEYEYAATPEDQYSMREPLPPLEDGDDDIVPFDTKRTKKPIKPYVPPTKFNPDAVNPYGGVLDQPLG